jgi:hypothetical protein
VIGAGASRPRTEGEEFMRKILAVALALLVAGALYAQTAVTSGWVSGNLVFYDVSKNIIATYDGLNRKLEIPSGSVLDLDAATGAVTFAAGEIVAADLATSSVETAEISNGTIINEDVSASAAIARSKLAEDALQIYGIPISEIRSDAGASLTAAETAGTFDITVGTNTIVANGEVTDNETETSVAYFQIVLPPEYVAAGDVTVRMPSALIKTGAPTNNGSTLDIAVYEQSDAGAVGSDLSTTTAAATYAALDTWYNKDFVITATDLVAGDVLNVKITATVIDSEAGAGTIVLNLAPPKVLLDVKG